MGFTAKASTSKAQADQPPPGNHPAVLVGLIDLGTQDKRDFKDPNKSRAQHSIYLVWELFIDEAKYLIGREFNMSLNSKATLRKFVESWRGKVFAEGEDFDVRKILGAKCLLAIIHKPSGDRMFASVDGVSAVPKGLKVPTPSITPVAWEISGQTLPGLDWLPYLYGKSVDDHVKDSHEYRGKVTVPAATAAVNQDADDVGF